MAGLVNLVNNLSCLSLSHPHVMADIFQDKFEAVNKAYEFLCSKSAKTVEGPDPKRIVLLLRTQSIIFTRCAESKQCLPAVCTSFPFLTCHTNL